MRTLACFGIFSTVSSPELVLHRGAMNEEDYQEPKIYLLPNAMTAGNLCCGFLAVLTIFNGMEVEDFDQAYPFYKNAILFIFGSCIFDLLDGRLARLGGQESPFGQEFDSIADVVSFGMAPALLVSKAVLFSLPEKLGWVIAFVYLLCGAMRLARFNCLANLPKKPGDSMDFRGIPIPMAAGFIASLTFLLIHLYTPGIEMPMAWRWILAAAMVGLSALMISNVRYPSFKKIDWSTRGSVWSILGFVGVIWLLFHPLTRWYTPTVIFSVYLLYGVLRPWLSKSWQRKIDSGE